MSFWAFANNHPIVALLIVATIAFWTAVVLDSITARLRRNGK